ncbi:hypothetical protein GE09DRAFT_274328 [Coniochaeta sp. 2T2.1]|nr:hypothetical protein GE09DRAFT_274328 [Coniochaeta sp. 2T2.1]
MKSVRVLSVLRHPSKGMLASLPRLERSLLQVSIWALLRIRMSLFLGQIQVTPAEGSVGSYTYPTRWAGYRATRQPTGQSTPVPVCTVNFDSVPIELRLGLFPHLIALAPTQSAKLSLPSSPNGDDRIGSTAVCAAPASSGRAPCSARPLPR